MVLLAILSGLINLSAQTVFLKVVSMTAGDLYSTYIIVALTFIIGSGMGGFYSHLIRPWLHWVELLTGCYTLIMAFFLSGPFYEYDVPLWLTSISLIFPALAFGTHIPLYGYYLRRLRFGLLYWFYHFGAVLGLIAFEWYFVHAGSVKMALTFTGSIQLFLGLLILQNKFRGSLIQEKSRFFLTPFQWLKRFPKNSVTVLFASTFSYYEVFWALRTQSLITDAFRLHATLISSAVFFWMALAGISSNRIKVSSEKVLLAMGLGFAFIYLSFSPFSLFFTSLFDGSLPNYFFVSFSLSLYLTLPVFFSSLVFVSETRAVQKQLPVDVASGGLNLFSAIGNLLGGLIAGTLASHFWQPIYFITATGGCFIFFFILRRLTIIRLIPYLLFSSILLFAMFSVDLTQSIFLNHIPTESRASLRIENIFITSDAFSTMATYDLKADDDEVTPQKLFIVDGHLSHNLESSAEFIVGLIPAMYFKIPPKKSMVIGLGSGQTAWATTAISEYTELVEISKSVINNITILKEHNFNLRDRKNVGILLKDGLSVVRNCRPESYDLIINTSTYPSNHGASKLYSDEMIELIERCLNKDGVMVTYFDSATVNDMTDFYEFVYPIMRHFRHVDIALEPYPIVLAYSTSRILDPLSAKDFLNKTDYDLFSTKYPDAFSKACRPLLRYIPSPSYEPLLSSLDRSYLERNSLRLSIRSKNMNFVTRTFPEFYHALSHSPVYSCE